MYDLPERIAPLPVAARRGLQVRDLLNTSAGGDAIAELLRKKYDLVHVVCGAPELAIEIVEGWAWVRMGTILLMSVGVASIAGFAVWVVSGDFRSAIGLTGTHASFSFIT